jgi:hypothetical protein
MVAAIEIYPPCFSYGRRSGGVRLSGVRPDATNCRNCSNDAGPKERAAIYRAALRSVCQCQNVRFHRFFAVFPGISLENGVFPGISRIRDLAEGHFARVSTESPMAGTAESLAETMKAL